MIVLIIKYYIIQHIIIAVETNEIRTFRCELRNHDDFYYNNKYCNILNIPLMIVI